MGNAKKPHKNGGPSRRKDAVECGNHAYTEDTCSRAAVAASTASSASSRSSSPPPPRPRPDSPAPPGFDEAGDLDYAAGGWDYEAGGRDYEARDREYEADGREDDDDGREDEDDGREDEAAGRGDEDDDLDDESTEPAYDDAEDDIELAIAAVAAAAAAQARERPLIDFSAVGEEIMMKPLRPAPRTVDDEFPAYVPWKASSFPAGVTGVVLTRRAVPSIARAAPACRACERCRCRVCRARCAADNRSALDHTVTRRGEPPGAASAARARAQRPPSSVGRWTRALSCLFASCLSPSCCSRDGEIPCADACEGNSDVAGCECVGRAAAPWWDAGHDGRPRRRHCLRRRHRRASNATSTTVTTTTSTTVTTTNSTTVNGSSSSTTNGGGAMSNVTWSTVTLSAAANTAADRPGKTFAKADVHDDADSAEGAKNARRPRRDYRRDTD